MTRVAAEARLRAGCVRLPVCSATATGATELAAFHRALMACGVGHFNLVRLSSVIPPDVAIVPDEGDAIKGGWGDRLYCVYAQMRVSVPGQEAWAAVGWIQRVDGGGGLLVEHEAGDEGEVVDLVRRSLTDMAAEEPYEFHEPQWVVRGVRCEDRPVAALVIVPFVTSLWEL